MMQAFMKPPLHDAMAGACVCLCQCAVPLSPLKATMFQSWAFYLGDFINLITPKVLTSKHEVSNLFIRNTLWSKLLA